MSNYHVKVFVYNPFYNFLDKIVFLLLLLFMYKLAILKCERNGEAGATKERDRIAVVMEKS